MGLLQRVVSLKSRLPHFLGDELRTRLCLCPPFLCVVLVLAIQTRPFPVACNTNETNPTAHDTNNDTPPCGQNERRVPSDIVKFALVDIVAAPQNRNRLGSQSPCLGHGS